MSDIINKQHVSRTYYIFIRNFEEILPIVSEVETQKHKKHPPKNLQISRKIRRSHRKCSAKIGVLKVSQISQENACVGDSF